nr:MBL fold metallo-hydrolase [uncultured Cellulosilyticum sp.]
MIANMTVGMLQEHTYFFIDDTTKHGFIIDPGAEGERILKYIQQEGIVIEKILLTHGHFDHVSAVTFLKNALNVPVVIHTEGKKYLEDANWNLSGLYMHPFTLEADAYVNEGDEIVLEANPEMKLRVIYVPGHTLDGVAYYAEKEEVAFVGDIIFQGAVGRSDNLGGNGALLLQGIREKIFTLPEETLICPGHGDTTTVKIEKATNPYFNYEF